MSASVSAMSEPTPEQLTDGVYDNDPTMTEPHGVPVQSDSDGGKDD